MYKVYVGNYKNAIELYNKIIEERRINPDIIEFMHWGNDGLESEHNWYLSFSNGEEAIAFRLRFGL